MGRNLFKKTWPSGNSGSHPCLSKSALARCSLRAAVKLMRRRIAQRAEGTEARPDATIADRANLDQAAKHRDDKTGKIKQDFDLLSSIGLRDRRPGGFWSAPAEGSHQGALVCTTPPPRAKAESRFACLRTPKHTRRDGVRRVSSGTHSRSSDAPSRRGHPEVRASQDQYARLK